MNLDQFVANFAAQLDETEPSTILASTKFRDLEEWSSLTALSIIAMVDDEYSVQLKGEDILKSQTVEDLYSIVAAKA